MPGRRTEWRLLQYVALAAFAIGFVGYTVFGWEFGGRGDPAVTALAIFAAAVAVVWSLARRL